MTGDAASGTTPDDSAAVAGRLLAQARLPALSGIGRLAGGKNNRVFQLDLADGGRAVLKRYHVDARDDRDRLGAEWRFLDYVWARGVRNVPQPLACDRGVSAGLYGFIDGRRLESAEIDAEVVAAAADFVVAINGEPRRPDDLAPGSEACFSLANHLATVDRRVARLDAIDLGAPRGEDAARFVATRLKPTWSAVRGRILTAAQEAGLDLAAPIGRPVVSPSDFGFHNMLRDAAGRSIFIDFEYAGRDDPAKLVCDFFCQPEVPVPAQFFDGFADRLAGALALSDADRHRCTLLLDAYRVKWVCIILNEFLPLGASRRAFADSGERAARCARQLARAETQIAPVSA